METDQTPSLDRLPERLRAIAGLVPDGLALADIGTDHGLLPVALVTVGRCPRAVATDLNSGPLAAAGWRVSRSGLDGRIETRIGDGLSPLKPGEVGVVVIAGMGGGTISGILERGIEVARGAARLILQPMNSAGRLRRWLRSGGFRLTDEDLVREGSRLYVIMAAEPVKTDEALGEMPVLSEPGEILIDLGPILWEKKHPLFPELVREELAGLRTILTQIKSARRPERDKQINLEKRIARMEGLLACWPK